MPVALTCQHCGCVFSRPPSTARNRLYCSRECYDKARYVPPDVRRERARQCIDEWHRRNPDKVRAIQARYYQSHTESRRANTARWRSNNPDKVVAYRRATAESFKQYKQRWNAAHRLENAARTRDYHRRNPGYVLEYSRRYRKLNPDTIKALKQRRRARKRQAPGCFTGGEWAALCAMYNHTCLCCSRCEPDVKLVPDHVIPLVKGGSNAIENIQPLCVSCNSKKAVRIVDYRTKSLPQQLRLFDDSHSVAGADEDGI